MFPADRSSTRGHSCSWCPLSFTLPFAPGPQQPRRAERWARIEKVLFIFFCWVKPNFWIWNDNTCNNRRSIELDDKWSRNVGQTACLCLILRRKGSHYSPVVCCSTLLLPHALFPHGFLSAVGYGSVGARLYLIPAVALSLLLFLLFPLLSFLSLCLFLLHSLSLSLPLPLPLPLSLPLSLLQSSIETHHPLTILKWFKTHRKNNNPPRHHRVHTTQMQTHQVMSALQTSVRCLSEKLKSDSSLFGCFYTTNRCIYRYIYMPAFLSFPLSFNFFSYLFIGWILIF